MRRPRNKYRSVGVGVPTEARLSWGTLGAHDDLQIGAPIPFFVGGGAHDDPQIGAHDDPQIGAHDDPP